MALKAAEGRYFVPVLHFMLSKFFPVDDAYKRQRLDCLGALVKIYAELESWDNRTSPLRLGELARAHLILYAGLGEQQTEDGL